MPENLDFSFIFRGFATFSLDFEGYSVYNLTVSAVRRRASRETGGLAESITFSGGSHNE